MCGFGGILSLNRQIDQDTLKHIASRVAFRGPDSTGFAMFDCDFMDREDLAENAFFFNRLAVLDLDARSNQPFQDENNLLLFNGEIYNYKDLKRELQSKGVHFSTTSDTEVLFYSLKTWGTAALAKLNGMFALFWLDKKNKTYLIARDRVGIKPIYFKKEGKSFIFASEMNSVIRLSFNKPELSLRAINDYLQLQYTPTPTTVIKDIYKLEPGRFIQGSISWLQLDKQFNSTPFWDAYTILLNNKKFEQAINLETLLVKSIESQLEADVPIGFFLSSGVDSSLLAAVANYYFKDRKFDFFTVGFNEKTISDESSDAQEYIGKFNNPNLIHHELTIDSKFLQSRIENMYDYFDEPFGDHASLLNWAISQKAREHVTVALSGDGADELFWGYQRYHQWWKRTYGFLGKLRLPMFQSKLMNGLPDSKVKNFLLNLGDQDNLKAYLNILSPRMFRNLNPILDNKDLWFLRNLDSLSDREDIPSIVDFKTYLPDAMLYKVDRSSMASSLEVRVPYLDNEIVDFALKTSLSEKSTSNFKSKAQLKTILAKLAPHYRINATKKGFNFPIKKWLREEWKELVLDFVTKKNIVDLGLEPTEFINAVDRFYHKGTDNTLEVWYLFNLVLWHEKLMDNWATNKT